jgi:hypothetical protein
MRKGITHLISEMRPSPTTGVAFFLCFIGNLVHPVKFPSHDCPATIFRYEMNYRYEFCLFWRKL